MEETAHGYRQKWTFLSDPRNFGMSITWNGFDLTGLRGASSQHFVPESTLIEEYYNRAGEKYREKYSNRVRHWLTVY